MQKNSTINRYAPVLFDSEGATNGPGVICILLSSLIQTITVLSNCAFQYNINVAKAGGIMEIIGIAILVNNCTFNRNNGSIYVFNS